MGDPPRILLVGPHSTIPTWLNVDEVTHASNWPEVVAQLDSESCTAMVLDAQTARDFVSNYRRDQIVMSALQNAVAILDLQGVVTWAHPVLRRWCDGEPVGRPYVEAISAEPLAPDLPNPFAIAAGGKTITVRLHRPHATKRNYLDITIRPIRDHSGVVRELSALARNVSAEVEQQKRLDALHLAGRELAQLDPDQLAEMNVPTRVELLRQNLRRHIHDLLHYDIIEVRLLDRRTGELRPLLEEGMTSGAANRALYASIVGNGVTGYVAATGESYLCPDAANDPHYIEGAVGARSSMTVPLMHVDEVIGTLNVESPTLSAFTRDDLQFTELFSKEIAEALHTLNLLTAQQSCTASQSIEAVNREIALPIDEIIAHVSLLAMKLPDSDPVIVEHLRHILQGAREVKASVARVERDLCDMTVAEATRTKPLKGKRVLIVDQDERMRRAGHLLLGRLGAEVESTDNATAGSAMLRKSTFDAVFLEVKPKDMGGYDAYRSMRAAREGVPVSLTTGFGYDSAHSIPKARQDGMKHVLFKPFRTDQVIAAVLDPFGQNTAGTSARSVVSGSTA